jgi:hypothetical protein
MCTRDLTNAADEEERAQFADRDPDGEDQEQGDESIYCARIMDARGVQDTITTSTHASVLRISILGASTMEEAP